MDNKSRYDAIREEFIDLTAQIIDKLAPLDPSIGHPDPKKCIYRIYRDLRFTQDKRPYKTHIAFFLSSYGIKRSGEAGYYLQIGQEDYGLNGNCSLGGGIFMPEKAKLAAIRQEIFYNIDEFLAIRNNKDYKKYFGDGVVLDNEIRYEWMRIPHFYYNFYVYKYATCICAASSIVKRIETQGEAYVNKYIKFLSCGGSKSPLDSLKEAEIDMNSPEVVNAAIEDFSNVIKQFTQLLN